MLKQLARESSVYGIALSPGQLALFERYAATLTEWSQRVNLVADADPAVVLQRHVLESIALGAALREREILRPDSRVLDVGAGAGFPGIVLKIVWPQLSLTLIDATAKKAAFLAAVVDELTLDRCLVLTGRAERLAHDPALRGQFDLVLARAVAPLPALMELTLPFARVGGRVVSPKGSRAGDELAASANALRLLHGKALLVPFHVPGPPQSLAIVIKQAPTPDLYPRREGVPRKHPL